RLPAARGPTVTPVRVRRWRQSALFLDLGLLATELAEVVQLRPPHVTAGDDVDVVDVGRVHREGPLDADAVALLAYREGLADPAPLAAQHHALEHLDALF